MHSSRAEAAAASQPCFNGCFPSPFLASERTHKPKVNNVTSSHDDFVAATSTSLHPHTQFTNPDSLPSLHDSYISFTKAFPQFSATSQVDEIRAQEYRHLNHSNACFDYTGYGLFSYAQQQRPCPSASTVSSSSSSSLSHFTPDASFFDISYRSVNLQSQVLYGGHESELEARIRKRIMSFMNLSEAEYTLVFIANEVSAFKIVADSFQFQSNRRLLTVYDHSSEALDVMIESCKKQGVRVLSSEFSWPNLGIQRRKLKKMVMNKREKRKGGLFVFPLHSRVTGAPYSYAWMSTAQENGWCVLLDVCALKPKEMDTLGMLLFKPDFMVCSFYKVFGENPSGVGCLFVKKSSVSALKDPCNATNIGIISLVPAFKPETEQSVIETETAHPQEGPSSTSEIEELSTPFDSSTDRNRLGTKSESSEIQCRGLDHADSVGLLLISNRTKYLVNWLVNALMSLKHPHHENKLSLIRVYGPKISSFRGPAVAFNIFDWKGEKIDPALVQKLADRNNICLNSSFLRNIRFLDKNEEERAFEVEGLGLSKKTRSHESGIYVVTAALGLLTNFEDIYRLWAFLSRFLDADFVEKEKWRYIALNQNTVEV
ncbi:molybdenum cofactor sulfurase-like [Vigna unguiculata]|uniref:Pyridoxal phosphate-dependent transferase n=1 Tax=Vigna unguiculata TaxID=3917 RepID=A0A4D6L0P9_VIGUN|nr:molybdenum cofactor sulfurase-like [Vigna unguiculata]QCD81194.1 Pyridoxal phosphate-dependent transferase [Vigna unguiculata]